MKKLLIAITAMLTLAATAMAEVKVAEAFSSHMVLQREKPVSVWGVADTGEKVKVSFGKQTLSTIADKAGLWRVTLKAMPANSRPQVMVISGRKNKIRLTDVLVGEVWLASGQSNMEYSMNNHPRYRKPQKGDADYQLKAWREANNPNIRVLYVRPDLNSDVLPTDGWQRVDSTSLKPVSAAAYFFARMLQDSLQVPVGFISSSWGGTRIEEWIPDGKTPGRRPMYEHLIRPLTGYALRGFLWYQGEANLLDLGETDVYTAKQEHLVDVWRGLWNDADLPFYYVQISPYLYSIRREDIVQKTWIDLPRFWTAQAEAMRQKNTGMVVTTDIPDVLNDIHPPYKWIVGERLCRWALNRTYGFTHVECQGPTLKGVTRDGDKVILEFDHCDGGLVTSDGKQPDWFWANTRNHGSFRKEDATIDSNKVILHIPESLAHPVIRFGYDETAQPNLRNKAGLPAAPFEYKL